MGIRPIRTEADYETALREISELMEVDPDFASPEGDRLDLLVASVQAYEAKHYPISEPNHARKTKIQK